jgi:hypothetical protein
MTTIQSGTSPIETLPAQESLKKLRLQIQRQEFLDELEVPIVESVNLQHHRLYVRLLPLAVAAR